MAYCNPQSEDNDPRTLYTRSNQNYITIRLLILLNCHRNVSFCYDVPLIDGHQLEECDEGGDDVVEVVAAVVIAGEVRVLV